MSARADISPIYQSIKDTVKTTGLSEYFLRRFIAENQSLSVKSGTKIYINVPGLIERLGGTGK